MDLKKFTPDYIAATDTETLNSERKKLIRATCQLQELTRAMREELVRRGEEKAAEDHVAQMSDVKRAAVEKALAKSKTSGQGSVH